MAKAPRPRSKHPTAQLYVVEVDFAIDPPTFDAMQVELNRLRAKFDEEVRAMVPDLDLPNIPTSPAKAVTGYLSGLVSGTGTSTTAVGEVTAEAGDAGVTSETYHPRGAWGGDEETYDGESSFQPLLGRQEAGSARRPPSVPSWSSVGTLSADTRSADTVFVFDEPSMN